MIDADERVLLVDKHDQATGSDWKLAAHRKGLRHRAVSVFITDGAGRLLLQSRSASKYHSAGLWSNACCGHPRIGEGSLEAAGRRLAEEMGIRPTLRPVGVFSYSAALPGGWMENEVVHLFTGVCDAEPQPDAREVGEWRRVSAADVRAECTADPDRFSAWFRIYLDAIPDVAMGRV